MGLRPSREGVMPRVSDPIIIGINPRQEITSVARSTSFFGLLIWRSADPLLETRSVMGLSRSDADYEGVGMGVFLNRLDSATTMDHGGHSIITLSFPSTHARACGRLL